MKFAIIVPARKGSQAIKNKNIIKIRNKSLIEYTFEKINNLNYKKFVLSNDQRVLKIAKKFKIDIRYKRPNATSQSRTSTVETLIHFIDWLKIKEKSITDLIILQPTSPLRTKKDILNSIKIYSKNKFLSLFSISESLEHPYETIDLKNFKKNKWEHVLPKSKNFFRRQDFDINSYFINGAIYIINIEQLKKIKSLVTKKHGIYIMKKINSFDINDQEDLEIIKKLI